MADSDRRGSFFLDDRMRRGLKKEDGLKITRRCERHSAASVVRGVEDA